MAVLLRVARGLGAAVVLGLLLLVPPWLLVTFVGNPWPNEGVSLAAPLTDAAFIGLIAAVAWVAWVQLVGVILVETVRAVRGIRLPERDGVLGGQQRLVRGMVSAVAATIVVSSAAAAEAATHSGAAVAAAEDRPQASTGQKETGRMVTVTTRHGDTVWGLAIEHLGDGQRWHEIDNLNRGRVMPDGQRWHPDRIEPGWKLRIPAGAEVDLASAGTTSLSGSADGPTVHVRRGDTLSSLAAQHLGDADRWGEIADLNRGRPQSDGGRLQDPDRLQPGWVLRIPGLGNHPSGEKTAGPDSRTGHGPQVIDGFHKEDHASSETGEARQDTATREGVGHDRGDEDDIRTEEAPRAADSQDLNDDGSSVTVGIDGDDDAAAPVWVAGGIAGILAAGIVGLVARRRLLQRRKRKFGERIAMPEPEVAAVERELRAGEDPQTVESVDVAFRLLAEHCHKASVSLPRVQLVRLTQDTIEAYLAGDDAMAGPFEPTDHGGLWVAPRASVDLDDEERAVLRARVPAPFPTLATLGVDVEGGHLLVNLEELGAVGVSGDATVGREVLSAMALELAMCGWADDLLITVVGLDEQIVDLDTGRIVHRPWDAAIETLEVRARRARAELERAGESSAAQARVDEYDDGDGGGWVPEIIIVAGDLDVDRWERLAAIVEDLPRVAVATIAQSATQARWVVEVSADGEDVKAVLQPAGVQVVPQRVTNEMYAELVTLVETTSRPSSRPEVGRSRVGEQSLRGEDGGPADLAGGGYVPGRAEALVEPGDVEPYASPVGDEGVVPDRADADVEEIGDGWSAASVDDGTKAAGGDESAAPRVLVLGPVGVEGAHGPIGSERQYKAVEAVAYLALRPGFGVEAFADAVWPDRGPKFDKSARSNRVTEIRKWLADDPQGEPYLPVFKRGSAYQLHPAVRSDWDRWCAIVGDDVAAASTRALEAALALVRGRPFEGTRTGTYTWADEFVSDMLSVIVDVSDELGRRMLEAGDWAKAHKAAATGLLCEPVAERLYRTQIRAAYAAGNLDHAREVIETMLGLFDTLEVEIEDDQTAALLQQIKDHAPRDQVVADIRLG